MSLNERILQIKKRILAACERSGRNPDSVNIVAVTKFMSLELTRAVLDAGITHVGENRPHIGVPKWEALGGQGTWHFIGSLQSRKVKDVVGKFEYIHSLDRLSLAHELEKRATAAQCKVKAFLQVNVSGEETKHGISPQEAEDFLKHCEELKHVTIVGLMTMAPDVDNPELARPVFRRLRELRDELNCRYVTAQPLTELSMGMSGDFEVAIEEGSSWIRLGSILMEEGEEG